jgi:ferredoxin
VSDECPWCGRESVANSDGGDCYWRQCTACGACGPICPTERQAGWAWTRLRQTPDRLAKLLAAIDAHEAATKPPGVPNYAAVNRDLYAVADAVREGR